MKKIMLIVTVISVVSGLSFQSFAKGRQNNHEPVYIGPLAGSIVSICGYRSEKNIAAQRKNGVIGKAYEQPQGDEGIQVAFSPFLALTPACVVNLGYLADFADADPLPNEQ